MLAGASYGISVGVAGPYRERERVGPHHSDAESVSGRQEDLDGDSGMTRVVTAPEDNGGAHYQPRSFHSGSFGFSAPIVLGLPWPG